MAANRGFASKQEADKAARVDAAAQKAISLFTRDAGAAADKGLFEVVVYEVETSQDVMSDEDKEVIAVLKNYFEKQGFTSRVHGPFVAGGPSRPRSGFDLYICW